MTRQDTARRMEGRTAAKQAEAPDLPLRDRKKVRQRTEFLRIALELFRQEGFEKTRMEDIAARALVSTPTVYNYFPTKRDVLIEILMEDRRVARDSFERVVSNPPAEPADAFATLIYKNMSDIRRPEDKRLWRELLAAVALSHDSERDPFEDNHEVFKGYVKRLLTHYMQGGQISDQIPLELAADLIFAVNSHNLRYLVASRFCSPERIRKIAREQIALLMASWLAPSSGEAAAPKGAKPPSRAGRKHE